MGGGDFKDDRHGSLPLKKINAYCLLACMDGALRIRLYSLSALQQLNRSECFVLFNLSVGTNAEDICIRIS